MSQETIERLHSLDREEPLWHEESPGQPEHKRISTEKPDMKPLDKLEQQLMMSGFSYLIPKSEETETEIKTPEGYSYERRTISSSYYSYKGKGEDNQHGIRSNIAQDQTGLPSQYHSPFKHFHAPITQVLPSSNSLPSITSIREGPRNHSTAIGSHHLSTRPHLASPGEFMSSSKGKSPEHGEEKPSRYIPPPLRMNEPEVHSTITGNDVSQPPSWYSNSCTLVNNTWSPSEQHIPTNWPSIPSGEETRTNIPFGSTDGFSSVSQHHEDRDLKQQTSSSYQEDAAAALQHHLEGPSAFHDPKNNQQAFTTPFSLPVKNEKGIISQLQASVLQQKQLQPTKPQNSLEDERTLKKELSWQKWKFQRNVKRVLEKVNKENVDDIGYDINTVIADSKLSKNFEGVSEVILVLEMIVEKVLDKKGFANPAARICHVLSGLDIVRFPDYFQHVVTTFRDSIVENHTMSDWKQRCQRFCNFLGEMFLNLIISENNLDESFKSIVTTIVNQSLGKWSSLEKDKPEEELHVFVVCLASLLHVIGPTLDDDSLRSDDVDIEHIFSSVREQVLCTVLPRSVRNDLLDLMLSRAAGWPEDPQEIDNDSADDGSDGVTIEQDGSQGDESSPNDDVLEDWAQNDDEDWDPYAKVHAMLQKLKLENLFEKFKENCIRDSLLVANKEDLKKTLQEAGFPPGVILEIRMYLEKGDIRSTATRNTHQSRSNDIPVNSKDVSGTSEAETIKNLETKEKSTRRIETTVEKTVEPDNEDDEVISDAQEEPSKGQTEQANINHETASRTDPHSTFDLIASYQRYPSKTDRKKPTLEHTVSDETKAGLIDAHNLFEPSYLSRTLPLKVDTTCYEYETGPHDSPNTQGPKSYSAVVKSKNEEHSPEATGTKTMPVKLTSLTKAVGSDGPKDVNQGTNKPTLSKITPKESIKETPGKRDQGSSSSRPQSGFPPPPPQNWGQSPEIRLTVLNSRQRGRSEDGPSVAGVPDGRVFRGGMTRGGLLSTRGKAAPRGRVEQRWKGGGDELQHPAQNWQGRTMTGIPSNWRQGTDTRPQDDSRNKLPYNRLGNKTDGASNLSYGGGFSQNKPETMRPFGEGGPKACFNCGSKDHFTCHDRSKMFFD